jgi:hypothetical protein
VHLVATRLVFIAYRSRIGISHDLRRIAGASANGALALRFSSALSAKEKQENRLTKSNP